MDSVHNKPDQSQSHSLSIEKPGKLANGQNLTVLLKAKSKIDQKIHILSKIVARQQTHPEFRVQLKINEWKLQFLKGEQQRLAVEISKIARKVDIQPENIDAVLTDIEGSKAEPPISRRAQNKPEQGPVKDKGKEKEEEFVPIDPFQQRLKEKVNLSKTQPHKLAELSITAANTEIKDVIDTIHDLLTNSEIYDDDLALKFNSEIKKFDREPGLKPLLESEVIGNQGRKQILSFVNTLSTMARNYEDSSLTYPNHKLSKQLDKLYLKLIHNIKQNLDKEVENPLEKVLAPSPDSKKLAKIDNNLNEFKTKMERYYNDLKFLTDFIEGAKSRVDKTGKKNLINAEKILVPQMKEIESLLAKIRESESTDKIGEKLAHHFEIIDRQTINNYFDKQEKIIHWYFSQFENQKDLFHDYAKKCAKKNKKKLISNYVQSRKEQVIEGYVNKNINLDLKSPNEIANIRDDMLKSIKTDRILVKYLRKSKDTETKIAKTIMDTFESVCSDEKKWELHFQNLKSGTDQMSKEAGKRVEDLIMFFEVRTLLADLIPASKGLSKS